MPLILYFCTILQLKKWDKSVSELNKTHNSPSVGSNALNNSINMIFAT